MHEPFDISTVIFALLAVFVVWKLRSVLGTRTGTERPPFDPFAARRKAGEGTSPPAAEAGGNVIRLPGADARAPEEDVRKAAAAEQWVPFLEPGSRALDGLKKIAEVDRGFEAESFMHGARRAYEMIVTAFAAGDRAVLEPLLAKDVFDGFAQAIAEREAQGRKVETTFVAMDNVRIEDAQLRGRTAQVGIRFQSQMISVTRNREGEIVDGRSDQVAEIVDLWTFARDTESRDPNWKLVATEAGA